MAREDCCVRRDDPGKFGRREVASKLTLKISADPARHRDEAQAS